MDGTEAFADVAARLHHEPSVQATVDQLVRLAVQATGSSEAGVALVDRQGCLQVAAVTGPVVAELYELQTAGTADTAGPLVAAFSAHDALLVADTASDQRWPAWAQHARRLGIRSVVHLPLPADRPLGVLSLFSVKPNAFDHGDIEMGHMLARHAAVAVENAKKEQNLLEAIDSRNLIGQAQGILMARYNLDADQAFAVLRRYSQDNNIKLKRIAQQVIETRRLPDRP